MLTRSVVTPLAQGPASTVHWNTFSPTVSPVTSVFGSVGSARTPVPWTRDQVPVPGKVYVLPARNTALKGVQMLWSGPAAAAASLPLNTRTTMVSEVVPLAQGPLSTVQTKTFSPIANPVTPEVGEDGAVIEPAPLSKVQAPAAGKVNGLPASTVLSTGVQSSWSGPALASGLFSS